MDQQMEEVLELFEEFFEGTHWLDLVLCPRLSVRFSAFVRSSALAKLTKKVINARFKAYRSGGWCA